MLSNKELQEIRKKLATNPPSNVKRKLKNQLIEHEYASTLPPFEPLSHIQHFINRQTDEDTLNEIIDAAKQSEIILLDTEMVPVYLQPNRPGLIQLELIPPNTLPTVILIEVKHLPPKNSKLFERIKELFWIVLDPEKIVYTWGTIYELEAFLEFGLFETDQIYRPENEDLQDFFGEYRRQYNEHQQTNDCRCEECIGRKPNQAWKLIDAIADQLGEWLDKRFTCSPFDCGLDPRLGIYCRKQIDYRNILTNYAANDVLAMEKLIIHIQERPPPLQQVQQRIGDKFSTIHENISSPRMTDEIPMVCMIHSATSIDSSIQQSHPVHKQQRSDDEHYEQTNKQQQQQQPVYDGNGDQRDRRPNRHDVDGRYRTDSARRNRNRMRTLKQRERYYRYEIIRRNIDPRFSITMVKKLLGIYEIPCKAVNISKSTISGRTSLYIGISDPTSLHTYETRTKNLFSTESYNEFSTRYRI